jgi:hypothetical protein
VEKLVRCRQAAGRPYPTPAPELIERNVIPVTFVSLNFGTVAGMGRS